MHMSQELTAQVVDGVNKAIERVGGTNGPLLSFLTIEGADGTRGSKDLPNGSTTEDLVAAASLPGVQRCVLLSSGNAQGPDGEVPILLVHAAERGDPKGLVLVQQFTPGSQPRFAQPMGQIQAVQLEDNVFAQAPFALHAESVRHNLLLQESFVRFGRRLMGQAFGDEDPRIHMAAMTAVDGEDAAEGTFQYVHTGSGTRMRLEFEYRRNTFAPTRFLQIDADENANPLEQGLGGAILQAYEQ